LYEGVKTTAILKGLEAAQGYIRSQLARRIKIRHIPELIFKIDHSYLQARRVDDILNALPPAADTLSQEENASD
jgi:ribosome-binding factor A